MTETPHLEKTHSIPTGKTIEVDREGRVTDVTTPFDEILNKADNDLDRIVAFSWNSSRLGVALLYAYSAYSGNRDAAIMFGITAAFVNLAPRLGGVIDGAARGLNAGIMVGERISRVIKRRINK